MGPGARRAFRSPQPPPPPPSSSNTIDFAHQPYLPGASAADRSRHPYLFYLDVWTRPVTLPRRRRPYRQGRRRRHHRPAPDGLAGQADMPAGNVYLRDARLRDCFPPPSAGLLSTSVVPNPSAGPCCLTTGTGYTGVENQFYRVEIHQGGAGQRPPAAGTAPHLSGRATTPRSPPSSRPSPRRRHRGQPRQRADGHEPRPRSGAWLLAR